MKKIRLSALGFGRLYTQDIFLVPISVRNWVDRRTIMPMSIENSSYTIGNRTRYLPACRAISQPNALPCVPLHASMWACILICLSMSVPPFSQGAQGMQTTNTYGFMTKQINHWTVRGPRYFVLFSFLQDFKIYFLFQTHSWLVPCSYILCENEFLRGYISHFMQNAPYVTQTCVSCMQISIVGLDAKPVAVSLLRKLYVRQQKKFYLHFSVPDFKEM